MIHSSQTVVKSSKNCHFKNVEETCESSYQILHKNRYQVRYGYRKPKLSKEIWKKYYFFNEQCPITLQRDE